jgi:serine O-acetyltransferase
LSTALFPTHYGPADLHDELIDDYVAGLLEEALATLQLQVRRDLAFADTSASPQDLRITARAHAIVSTFAAKLTSIRNLLVDDLRAAFHGDPAATNYPEILLGYPGMIAVIYYRLARVLYELGATMSARMIGHIAHSKTAVDIHPGAQIGKSFFIDHGTGVVIGETAVIGERVRLYQAVTLGARSFHADGEGRLVKGEPRHPIIEDDVIIYAGATILGRVTIGRGSVVGGNVWLTRSVPAGSNIAQAQNAMAPIPAALQNIPPETL